MKRMIFTQAVVLTLLTGVPFALSPSARAGDISAGQRAVEAASKNNQFAFIFFYRSGDVATKNLHGVLKSVVTERKDTAIVPVQVADSAEEALVKQFDATRIPMPAIAVLAPNGAVCSVFPQRATPQQLTAAIVSQGQAACLKAIQDQKIVLLCAQPQGSNVIPAGVRQFQADDLYKNRTQVVSLTATDPAETKFLNQLQLPTNQQTPVVACMAPPGIMLGTFNADVTHATLAQKLAAAGKCCDDENCKHHQAAGGNQSSRR